MATSSIANLFSFFAPSSKPPPTIKTPAVPPSNLSVSTISSSSRTKDEVSGPVELLSLSNDNQQLYSQSSSELMSVVCPSLAYSNTLFFRSAYNVQVIVDDNEHEEKLLNRFRREVMRAGVIQECRRRRYFENKQDKEKRKARDAAKRNRRRRPQARSGPPDKQEISNSKSKKEDDEDNWELPVGDLPY